MAGSAGIKVSQAGVSIPLAADYQFVFNSDWPSLQTGFDHTVTVGVNASVTLNHKLGFPPFVQGWILSNGVSLGRIFAMSESFEAAPQSSMTMSWDKNNIYLSGDSNNSYDVHIKCFNIDISKSVDYTLPQPPVIKIPYDPSTGIKVTKYGKSITSSDLRDFILHSRCQSPAVLSILAGNSSTAPSGPIKNDGIYYTNPAGYVPWTFAFFVDSNGHYQGLAPGGQQTGTIFILTNDVVTWGGNAVLASTATNVALSLVVLRDPLIIPNTVMITYNGSPVSG